jgi:serine/threonine protein kinase
MESTVRCLVCGATNPTGATICSTCGASIAGDPATGYSTALPTGRRLKGGAYTVGKVLGQGGFGITYLGSDARLQRLVAIKEFFPYGSLREGPEVRPAAGIVGTDYSTARERFLDESRVLAQFRHPGIVDVFDSFQENNTAYMVMEYLQGQTLGQLLEEHGALEEPEAVEYISQVGDALAVVHDASLLHRDLKPDNVMITDDGRVVLIDFGTARAFTAGRTGRMTTMVTPGYAPLEQYGSQVHFGPFTDVYALGATLYHALTGQMPAPATDRASGVELQSPHALDSRISVATSDSVMWALEMRIDRRPQTVRSFLDALPVPERYPDRLPSSRAEIPPVDEMRSPAPLPLEPSPLPALEGDPPFYITVGTDRVIWPDMCACCAGPPNGQLVLDGPGTDSWLGMFSPPHEWEVPYCSVCLEHVEFEASHSAKGPGAIAAAAPIAGLVLGGPLGMLIGTAGAAAASLFGEAQRQKELGGLLTRQCVAVGPAIGYQSDYDGAHTFVFLNPHVADEFRLANADSLML